MIFRRLAPSDAAEYRRLRLFGLRESPLAFGSSFEEESKRALTTYVARLEKTEEKWTLGAFSGKRLIGAVTLVRDASLKGKHKAGIYGMYVSPRWRKKGVGRELINRVIVIATHLQGLKQLHLTVTSSNPSRIKALRICRILGLWRGTSGVVYPRKILSRDVAMPDP